jgi:hypothetical protein
MKMYEVHKNRNIYVLSDNQAVIKAVDSYLIWST